MARHPNQHVLNLEDAYTLRQVVRHLASRDATIDPLEQALLELADAHYRRLARTATTTDLAGSLLHSGIVPRDIRRDEPALAAEVDAHLPPAA